MFPYGMNFPRTVHTGYAITTGVALWQAAEFIFARHQGAPAIGATCLWPIQAYGILHVLLLVKKVKDGGINYYQ